MREKLTIPETAEGWVWSLTGHHRTARQPHSHDELELNLVVSGSARYLVEGTGFDLLRGTLIWLFPDQEHVLVDESEDLKLWIAVFRPPMIRRSCRTASTRPLTRRIPNFDCCRLLATRATLRLQRLFEEVAGGSEEPDRHRAGLSYLLLEAWALSFKDADPYSGFELHPAVERAVRLLRESEEPDSLSELARRCGASPAHLSHLFKQQTGMGISAYRQRRCLERFLDRYRDPQRQNMLETALQAGFGSYAQFYRVFCRCAGTTPAAYRKQMK